MASLVRERVDPIARGDAETGISVHEIPGILWRRRLVFLLIIAACCGLAYYVTLVTPHRYRATAQMLVVNLSDVGSAPESSGNLTIVPPETVSTQVMLLTSTAMAERALAWQKRDNMIAAKNHGIWEMEPEDLQQILRVSSPAETSLLDVTVESSDPRQASLLANAVCRAFESWKKEVALEKSKETTQNLEVRAARARAQMQRAEQAQLRFKRRVGLVDIDTQHRDALDQYLKNNTLVHTIRQDLTAQEQRLALLKDRLAQMNRAIRSGVAVRDDALVMSLQSQLSALEIQRADLAQKVTPEFPGVLAQIDAKIADVKRRLEAAIQGTVDNRTPSLQAQGVIEDDIRKAEAEVAGLRARFATAVAQRNESRGGITSIPMESMMFARLQNNVELARSLFNSAQSALSTAYLSRDMINGNVQIVASATPPNKPFSPDMTKNLVMGGALGMLLSLLMVLLLEQTDQRVSGTEDAKRLVAGQVIGVLPRMSASDMRRLKRGESPPEVREAYNLARVNLALTLQGLVQENAEHGHVVLVTSAVPGEGKSLSSSEMARSLARSGKRVLLIEADMRRPSQRRNFRVEADLGLADVLMGEKTLKETIVPTGVPNLMLLPSGTPRQNPSDLLSSPRFAEIVTRMREEADVVIFDAPACAVVPDSLLIAPYVDHVLFVIGVGMTDEEVIQNVTESLKAAAPNSMHVFVNRAPRERHQGYGYYRYARYSGEDRIMLSSGDVRPAGQIENGHSENGHRHSTAVEGSVSLIDDPKEGHRDV